MPPTPLGIPSEPIRPLHRSVLWLLLFSLALAAQDPCGAIAGQVWDTSGALAPGVTVRATNLDTNVSVSATSNPQGNYEIPYLLPGTYSITAELTGFKTWTQPKVELRMGDRLRSGNVAWLFSMAPGVILQNLPYDGPWNIDQASQLSVAGGAVNISLKSGTNALRGTLGTAVSSGPMMARNFFTNRFVFDPATGPITPEKIKANTPSLRWLRYSVAVVGPVYLPKLYDGRSKTFWMFGYQSHNRRRPNATLHTVPSGPSRYARQPLAGNRIPPSRLDPAARNILKYFPAPNTAGTADGLNNYSRTRQDTQDLYQPLARLDHNFSERHRMFARYSHSDFYGHFDRLVPDSKVRGRQRRRPHRGVALDNVFVLSPRTVLDLRYGFTWFQEFETFDNMGWNLSEFGFPASLIRELDPAGISFPLINISGLLQLGNDGGFKRVNDSHSLLAVLNWMKGNHSLKAGFDGRLLLETNKTYGNVAPRLEFAQAYTRGPLDNSPVAPAGQGLASFLLGIPTGGYVDLNDSRAESSRFYAGFLQDDWRISRKLTLNLGVRWEYESPVRERFNRSTRDFDFRTANPIEARAQAQYARQPIPEVPLAQFRTLGGVTFVGLGGNPRGVRDPYRRAFMPRFGFAFQLLPKVVLRGGYGIYFDLLGAEYTDVNQPGFNQRTNTYLGRSPGFFARQGIRPYTQRWSYSIQFQPGRQSLLEIGYLGSRSVRQRVSTEFNPVPRRYQSASPERDQATIDFVSARVANPFAGIAGFAGSTFFASANTNRSQLVRPYPHFSGLSTGLPAGSSWYHALTARFDRRLSGGLQLQANYTWSKTMEALAYLNDTDGIPEHVVSNLDRPHRVVLTAICDLPFGAGRRFASSARGLLDHLIGGWELDAIFQGQSGPPLGFDNVLYRGQYSQIRLSGAQQSLGRWFNTDAFERNPNLQLANNIRTFPSRVACARADGINVWDLAAHETFRLCLARSAPPRPARRNAAFSSG